MNRKAKLIVGIWLIISGLCGLSQDLLVYAIIGFIVLCLGVALLISYAKSKESSNSNNSSGTSLPKEDDKILLETINTKVVGVTFKCQRDPDVSRQDVIKSIYSLKSPLYLEPYEYEGEPANLVIAAKKGLDIGNLKATLSKELAVRYKGCEFKVRFTDFTGDDDKIAGCNIAVDIFK